MPRKKSNEFLAGLLSVAGVAVIVGIVLWLGVADLFSTTHQQAVFFRPEGGGSSGLGIGSPVVVNDAEVGKIQSIRYAPESGGSFYTARILREDLRLRRGAEARVVTDFLGNAVVVIYDRGDPEGPLASRDEPIELGLGGMGAILAELGGMTGQLQQMMTTLRDELNKDDKDAILAKVHAVMSNLGAASENIVAISRDVRSQTDPNADGSMLGNLAAVSSTIRSETDRTANGTLMSKVHHTMDDVNTITGEASPRVRSILQSAEKTMGNVEQYVEVDMREALDRLEEINKDIKVAAANFASLTGEAKGIVHRNRHNIDRSLDNLAIVSANLRATSAEIRLKPWKLLHRPEEKDIYQEHVHDAARAFAMGAEQVDRALARLQAISDPNAGTVDQEVVDRAHQELIDAYRNFNKVEQKLWRLMTNPTRGESAGEQATE
jgi:ABC-type transporter Mla subunit MlaD